MSIIYHSHGLQCVSFILGVFIQLSDITPTGKNRITLRQWCHVFRFISTINFAKLASICCNKYRTALFLVYLEIIDGLSKIFIRIAFHGLRSDWSHIIVHYCKFHEGQEDEYAAWGHPHVDRLYIRNRRQRLLRLRVLSSWKKNVKSWFSYWWFYIYLHIIQLP